VDSLFGVPAAKKFQTLWADHVDGLMAYTTAVVKNDAGKKATANAQLNEYAGSLGDFLAGASGRRIPASKLTQAIIMHDQMLQQQADAFEAKNYKKAYDLTYDSYQQMSALAGQLAGAFSATAAKKAPKGGPQTGLGGMADVVGRR
jgi:hypothetical protein